tara:strand:- start:1294 stop:1602 length:309 start_codon:yes stop_codon:yes gene_type:complete
MVTVPESCNTLQGKKDYYIVESYVDEIDECLVMRCSTIEGAANIADMLAIAMPDMTFDIKDKQPMIHLRDYNPEKYARVKEYIMGEDNPPRPRLILLQGGKK